MKLVEYKGGGYDGCFWEWNYFILTDDNTTHDIYSSGYKGATTHEDRMAILDNDYWKDRHSIHDLTIEDESLNCFSGMNAGSAAMIARRFLELELELSINAYCYNCEDILPVTDMIAGNWSGDGGIAYSPHDLFCEDCAYLEEEE